MNYGFMTAEIDDMHYCSSHDFWYDPNEQDRLLHLGLPCIYTDTRYDTERGSMNSYRKGAFLWRRRSGYSLRALKRRLKKTRNIPVGTLVNVQHNSYGVFRTGTGYSLGYTYKVRRPNTFNPEYAVNAAQYSRDFTEDDAYSKSLVDALRSNGFLVQVWNHNPDRLIGENDGEIAIAYGHGLRVGFSTGNNSFRGYQCGVDSILYDAWDHFDKWSRCREIKKGVDPDEVIRMLLAESNEYERLRNDEE